MSPWLALYVKEVKENRLGLGLLAGATACVVVYGLAHAVSGGALDFPPVWVGAMSLPYLSVLVLPFLLTHSVSREFDAQTHHQLLALPVPRAALMLAKVAAIFSGGVVICLLTTAAIRVASLVRDNAQMDLARYEWHLPAGSGYAAGTVDATVAGGYLAVLLLLLGMATLLAGLRLVVGRAHGLTAIVVFALSLYGYAKILGLALPTAAELATGIAGWPTGPGIRSFPGFGSFVAVCLVSTACTGLLYIAMGTWLFHRFARA
ncbi:MAG: ABC transporter permease [Candidatus Latescibacterota bacterium]